MSVGNLIIPWFSNDSRGNPRARDWTNSTSVSTSSCFSAPFSCPNTKINRFDIYARWLLHTQKILPWKNTVISFLFHSSCNSFRDTVTELVGYTEDSRIYCFFPQNPPVQTQNQPTWQQEVTWLFKLLYEKKKRSVNFLSYSSHNTLSKGFGWYSDDILEGFYNWNQGHLLKIKGFQRIAEGVPRGSEDDI